jgi:apolipoprotein N-acyltransferase
LAVASAFILSLCFVDRFSALAWVALIPLGLLWHLRLAGWGIYLSAFVAGAAFHLASFDWMRTRAGWAGAFGNPTISWLLTGCLCGLFWIPMVWAGFRLRTAFYLPATLLMPLTWVSYEFVRKYALAAIDQTGFPWLQLGLSQAPESPIAQTADLGGVWLVSALIAAANGMGVDLLINFSRRACWSPLAGGMVLATGWLYGQMQLHHEPRMQGPRVALVPGECAPERAESWLPSLKERAEILLWSEGGTGAGIAAQADHDDDYRDQVLTHWEAVARSTGRFLALGCRRISSDGTSTQVFNTIAFVDPLRGYVGAYDKRFLVPWGEFTPRWRRDERVVRTAARNTDRSPCFPFADWKIGAAICYDVCFPECFSQADGVPDFVLVAGAECADPTFALQRAMLRMSSFRAIELRRSIIRNVELGFSGLIDSNGRLRSAPTSVVFDVPFVTAPVPIDDRFSLYRSLGDWFAWGVATSVGALLAVDRLGALRRIARTRGTVSLSARGDCPRPDQKMPS